MPYSTKILSKYRPNTNLNHLGFLFSPFRSKCFARELFKFLALLDPDGAIVSKSLFDNFCTIFLLLFIAVESFSVLYLTFGSFPTFDSFLSHFLKDLESELFHKESSKESRTSPSITQQLFFEVLKTRDWM